MRMPPHGFIAVELLIVIATAVTGISAMTVAVNPNKELATRRDAQRTEDVATLARVLHEHSALAHVAAHRPMLIGTATEGCNSGCSATTTQATCLDLTHLFSTDVPRDPLGGTASKTDYYAVRHTDGRLTVGACNPETHDTITATQ